MSKYPSDSIEGAQVIDLTDRREVAEEAAHEARHLQSDAEQIMERLRSVLLPVLRVVENLVMDEQDALHRAISEGDAVTIGRLIESGADIYKPDATGVAPYLHCLRWRPDMIKTLIENGLNPNHADSSGLTLLMKAVGIGNLQSVKALVQAGALPNTPSKMGFTALQYAQANILPAEQAKPIIEYLERFKR